ncbi:hypothetical protein B296_00015708, partial [Ensete ventricosum]
LRPPRESPRPPRCRSLLSPRLLYFLGSHGCGAVRARAERELEEERPDSHLASLMAALRWGTAVGYFAGEGTVAEAIAWWDEIDGSEKWQRGIFCALCASYALVSVVALVRIAFCNLGYDFLAHQIQLIRIQLRVPEYGWTTQKLFHLMNVVVNGRTSSFGCFGLNFFRLNFLLHINYHMDLQCARFCLVSIKTCFLSNQR